MANVEDITKPRSIRVTNRPHLSISRFTALAQISSVSRNPVISGSSTETSRFPIPSAIG